MCLFIKLSMLTWLLTKDAVWSEWSLLFAFVCLFVCFTRYWTKMKKSIFFLSCLSLAVLSWSQIETDIFFFFLKDEKICYWAKQLQLHTPETKDNHIFSFVFQMADKRNTRISINIWSKNLSFFPPLRSLSGLAQQVLLHF